MPASTKKKVLSRRRQKSDQRRGGIAGFAVFSHSVLCKYIFGKGEGSVVKKPADDILDNEFFTFLDPSGYGKTTLLRIIAGFAPAAPNLKEASHA